MCGVGDLDSFDKWRGAVLGCGRAGAALDV